MEEFSELFRRYLSNSLTAVEKILLAELVLSGKYDDQLKAAICELPSSRLPSVHLSKAKKEEIVRNILTSIPATLKTPITKSWYFRRAACVLVIVLGLLSIDGFDFFGTSEQHAARISNETEVHLLPDGSNVVLNIGSELSFAEDFGIKNREIFMSGEAYFDVMHDPSMPFIVNVEGLRIRVLGTAFNVNAYRYLGKIKVTVTRGEVEVSQGDEIYGNLCPDQELLVDIPTHQFQLYDVNAEEILVWKKKHLVLNNVTLSEAAESIGQYYNVTVIFSDPDIGDCMIHGAFFDDASLSHVLTSLCTVLHKTYRQIDNTIIIEGEGCY
jgi:transmembrane sensor